MNLRVFEFNIHTPTHTPSLGGPKCGRALSTICRSQNKWKRNANASFTANEHIASRELKTAVQLLPFKCIPEDSARNEDYCTPSYQNNVDYPEASYFLTFIFKSVSQIYSSLKVQNESFCFVPRVCFFTEMFSIGYKILLIYDFDLFVEM